ncbi:protein FAM174C [Hippocampus zosterae]|uniref:protein FAM174C n=1 Tax=Hippocampus zosterae TaxID=109293 RepID=UPI00223D635A|nr:protein FAM174C [Hippocampus zosterae]
MAATARSALLLPLLLILLPVWRTLAVLGAPQAHEASGPVEDSSVSNSSSTTAAGGPGKKGQTLSGFNADSSMVQRALYVLVAITAFGLLYFLIRAVRVKKTSPRKKYGLLARSEDSLELTAAVASDDDDDNTLYEARPLRRTEVTP